VSDTVLMGPAAELSEAIANLDEEGWNKDGSIFPVTRHRAILLLGPFHERALELMNRSAGPDLEIKAR
jgi:hypothetical protein